MNLTLHQFRKDVYQLRYVLYGVAVFLLLDLAITQGWVGQPNWVWPYERNGLGGLWRSWTSAMMIGAVFVVTIGSVLGDSTARDNAFLRTRPLPARNLWLGKVLFLGVMVVMPIVSIEFINLLLHGIALNLVLAGTWERFTLVLPLVGIAAGVAAACPQQKTFAAFIAVTYGVGFAGAGLIGLFFNLLPVALGREPVAIQVPDAVSLRIGFAVWAILVTGMAWWVVTRRPRALHRWSVVVIIILVGELAIAFGPHNPPIRGAGETPTMAEVKALPMHLPLNSISRISGRSKVDGKISIGWSVRPKVEGLPPGMYIRWGACSARLVTGDGQTHVADSNTYRAPVFGRYGFLTTDDLNCIGQLLPADAILESQNNHNGGSSMGYQPFELLAVGDWWKQPAKLDIEGEGHLYQWEIAAELDLAPGSSARVGQARWSIAASRVDQNGVYVAVENESVGLSMTANQDLRKPDSWPTERFEFLLYDPVRKLGRGLNDRHPSRQGVGGHTGFQRRWALLSFRESQLRQDGWRENPEKLRLLIFKQTYLGTMEKAVQANLVPSQFPSYRQSRNRMNDERLTRGEFLRRLKTLDQPPTTATRAQIGNYVYDVLNLIESARRYDESGPEIQALVQYVPAHLDLFIDGYGVTEGTGRNALMVAMTRGIRPEQKADLWRRLPDEPNLADVLIDRDWLDESKDPLFALLDYPASLPHSTLRALAWFDDPRVEDRLAKEFEVSAGGRGPYQIMAGLPRMAARLDLLVQDRWNRRAKFLTDMGSPDAGIELAVRHGNAEALAHQLRLLRLHTEDYSSSNFAMLQMLGEVVDLPNLEQRRRHDTDFIKKALLALGDVKFKWDPARRKYLVVKSDAQLPTKNDQ